MELLYYTGYRLKKAHCLRNRKRFPVRVVSIGNLTVGGTGKTPAVIAVAERAKQLGLDPCVLTRGYGGRARGPCFVSRGEGLLLSAAEAGDEAAMMGDRLRGVPIVKSADRYEGGMYALKHLNSERLVFILDDGFQHWRLERDLDIVLIDAMSPFGNRRLLPSGILREPIDEMKRADVIVLTRAKPDAKGDGHAVALRDEIQQYNPRAALFTALHEPVGLLSQAGREMTVSDLSGRAVFGFCGIGNPAGFRETLQSVNADLKGFMAFRDHYRYDRRDVKRISENAGACGADWIVTTEKDIMRLEGLDLNGTWVSLRIAFSVDDGFYERVFLGS